MKNIEGSIQIKKIAEGEQKIWGNNKLKNRGEMKIHKRKKKSLTTLMMWEVEYGVLW